MSNRLKWLGWIVVITVFLICLRRIDTLMLALILIVSVSFLLFPRLLKKNLQKTIAYVVIVLMVAYVFGKDKIPFPRVNETANIVIIGLAWLISVIKGIINFIKKEPFPFPRRENNK